VTDTRREPIDKVLGLAVEGEDFQLRLAPVAHPFEDGDLRERDVHDRRLEPGDPDESLPAIRPQHGREDLQLQIRVLRHRAHAMGLEPGCDELFHERLVASLGEDVHLDAAACESMKVEPRESALEGPDHELLRDSGGLRGEESARQRAASEQNAQDSRSTGVESGFYRHRAIAGLK
jgi:hypothetical protein